MNTASDEVIVGNLSDYIGEAAARRVFRDNDALARDLSPTSVRFSRDSVYVRRAGSPERAVELGGLSRELSRTRLRAIDLKYRPAAYGIRKLDAHGISQVRAFCDDVAKNLESARTRETLRLNAAYEYTRDLERTCVFDVGDSSHHMYLIQATPLPDHMYSITESRDVVGLDDVESVPESVVCGHGTRIVTEAYVDDLRSKTFSETDADGRVYISAYGRQVPLDADMGTWRVDTASARVPPALVVGASTPYNTLAERMVAQRAAEKVLMTHAQKQGASPRGHVVAPDVRAIEVPTARPSSQSKSSWFDL